MNGVQGDEEIVDIMGRVYKVRLFGLEAVNMGELNLTGVFLFSPQIKLVLII